MLGGFVLFLEWKLLVKPFLTPPTQPHSHLLQRSSSSSKPLCLKTLPRNSLIKVNGDIWSKIRPGRQPRNETLKEREQVLKTVKSSGIFNGTDFNTHPIRPTRENRIDHLAQHSTQNGPRIKLLVLQIYFFLISGFLHPHYSRTKLGSRTQT